MEPKRLTMLLVKNMSELKLESRTKCSQSLDIHIQEFGLAKHVDSCYSEDTLVL